MKSVWFFISFSANLCLMVCLGYFYFGEQAKITLLSRRPVKGFSTVQGERSYIRYPIAIVVPASHPSLEKIRQGFEETLAKKYRLNLALSVFNANGNKALLRAQIEEITQRNFALVFTIGAAATQLTKEVFAKKNISTPIVFGAVADPVRLGILPVDGALRGNITGSVATSNYPLQIELLLLLKPHTKKVLLLYDPVQSSGLNRDKDKIATEFKNRGVDLHVIEVFSTKDVQQKIPLVVNKKTDVVLILKDNTVVPLIGMLVKYCERYGVTLLASDLDSVDKGAAFGFGVREYSFGVSAAQCANSILFENRSAAEVPIKITDAFRFAINRPALERQGVFFEGAQQRLLEAVEFVG